MPDPRTDSPPLHANPPETFDVDYCPYCGAFQPTKWDRTLTRCGGVIHRMDTKSRPLYDTARYVSLDAVTEMLRGYIDDGIKQAADMIDERFRSAGG